jgi:hypothetical protein
MSKPKAKASKRARPKIAVAKRNKQAVVRSAKDNLLRSVAAGPIESPLELHGDSKQTATIVEKQKAPIVEERVALQDHFSQMKGFDFSFAMENMLAPQAKLLEMAQANVRFAFEFTQALAMVRSPFELFDVIAKFTKMRADMMLGMLS